MEAHLIRIGHSPDPDDAFMFYALARDKLDTGRLRFQHLLEGIETLNAWALEGRLEVTAISAHAYAYVADRYLLLGPAWAETTVPSLSRNAALTPSSYEANGSPSQANSRRHRSRCASVWVISRRSRFLSTGSSTRLNRARPKPALSSMKDS